MTDTLVFSLTQTLALMFAGALAGLLALVRGNLVALRAHVWFIRWRTWTVIAVVVLGALWLGGAAGLALVALIAWQAAREGATLLQLAPIYRRGLTALAPLAVLAVGLWPWLLPWLPGLAALTLALLSLVDDNRPSLPSVPSLVKASLGFVWTAWPLACVVRLGQTPDGIAWIVVLSITVGLADVGACLVGSALGGPRLAPVISPGKRWSGLLGAGVAAYAAFALLTPLRPALPLSLEIALPMMLALAGAGGDLVESWVKRSAGVKDAGGWLPGFGGLLDRIDSALLALPVGYLVLWLAAQ